MSYSLITNIDRRTGSPVPAAPNRSVLLNSVALGWNGITAELHRIPPDHQPEHLVRTHRLMVHLGMPTRFEFRDGGSWQARRLVPGTLSMLADGMPNEPRWHDTMEFLAVGLDPTFVRNSFGDALRGARDDLRPVRGEADPVASRLTGLINQELADASFAGALFGETLALAFALRDR